MKLGDAKPPNSENATASDSEKQITEQVKGIGSYLETLQDENQRLRDQNWYLQRSVDSYRDGHETQCVNVLSFIFVVYALGMERAGLLILHSDMVRYLAFLLS